MSYFSYYLPLKPRKNKVMMKSVTIGTLTSSLIYLAYGCLFYLMYGSQISDSADIFSIWLLILFNVWKSNIRFCFEISSK